MKKSRISTQEIAEIIVERFEEMKGYTQRVEKATAKEIEVDATNVEKILSKYENLISSKIKTLEYNLERFEEVKLKNEARLPNWMLISLFASYFFLCGVIGYLIYSTK